MQLTITQATYFKASTKQANDLSATEKLLITVSQTFVLHKCKPAPNKHWQIILSVPMGGRHEWYVFAEHVKIADGNKPVVWQENGDRQINAAGLELLKSFEGCRLTAYKCPAGVWTIGYGTTAGVRSGMTITQAEAERLLRRDLDKFERAVADAVKVSLTDNQFSALVSFTYNVGIGALQGSSVLRILNQGNYKEAADRLLAWNKAGGRELAGLNRRRQAERSLFLK